MELEDFQTKLQDGLSDTLGEYLESERKSTKEDTDVDNDEDPSIARYLRGAVSGRWENADKEASLYEEAEKYSSDVGGEGGLFIHPEIQEQIVPLIRKKAVIRSLNPTVVNLPNTNTLELPRQTQAAEAAWVGEEEDISSAVSQEVEWGDLELSLRTVAGFASVPNTLLEDATPAVDRLIREDLSKVIALKEDKAFLEGTGGKQPLGLKNRPEIDSSSLGAKLDASGNGFDDLIDMQTSIENNGGDYNVWLMNPTMKGYIRKLTDNDDKNIWQAGDVTRDEPDRLLGLPVRYTRQIPVGTAGNGATYIVLGDFSEFLIAQKRDGISMDASTEADGAFKQNQTKFRAIRRVTGGPRVPENFYILEDVYTQ